MAMTIKGNPILYGEDAEYFFEETQKNNHLPNPVLSHRRQQEIAKFLKESSEYKLPY